MELDLVDAMPEAVVGAEDRRVGVGEPSPRHRLAAGLDAEPPQTLARPAGALALDRIHEDAVGGEEIVTLERGRLVQHLVGRWHEVRVPRPPASRKRARPETRKGTRDTRQAFRSWDPAP